MIRHRPPVMRFAAFILPFLLSAAFAQNAEPVRLHIHRLTNADPLVRERAAEQLGILRSAEAVEPLIARFADDDPFVAGAASAALARIGNPALPALLRTVNDASPEVRRSALIALYHMGAAAAPAVPSLMRSAFDSVPVVRWTALQALGSTGPAARASVPLLLGLLSDADADVRRAAASALDRIQPGAVETNRDWKNVRNIADSLLPVLMKEHNVPGLSIVLVREREIVWSAQYGTADVRTGAPVTGETMFEACSMSKPVFGIIALSLTARGKLDLDRPLSRTLPLPILTAEPGAERITARMVLSHSTGLPNWRPGDEERNGPVPLLFSPGTKFGYSGEGMYVLQKAVEAKTGEGLDAYAERTLFRPLGLRHTSFAWTPSLDTFIAAGHDERGAYRMKSRYIRPNAAYSLYTSASDYARFLIAVMGNERTIPLPPALRKEMLSPQRTADVREPVERPGTARGTSVSWGLGWCVTATGRGPIHHHSGANRSGFRCYSQFDDATGNAVVVMTNGAGGGELWTRLISRIGNF